MKNKIFISVIFSSVICSLITFIVPRDFDIKGMMISQIVTCIFFDCRNPDRGIGSECTERDMVYRDEKKARSGEGQSGLSDSVVPGFKADAKQSSPEDCLYADPGMIGWRITKHAIVPAVSLGAAILMLTGPGRTVAGARRRTVRGDTKVFPGWVMELVLLLQTNNVFMSVEATRDRAPVILREPVRQLLSEMQAAPGSVYPYLHFLDDF